MAEPNNNSTYVITQKAVHRALKALETVSIHEHFAGYLAILRGFSSGVVPVQSKAIWDFHRRYLQANSKNGETAFVSPFASRGSSVLHVINPNVAGSYGPSSMREGKPLAGVLDVQGTGTKATYSLKPKHAILASEKLLKGGKVPAFALATFLYRDYGLRLEAPEISRVLTVFRAEFGFSESDPDADQNFAILFHNDKDSFGPDDLELITEADHG